MLAVAHQILGGAPVAILTFAPLQVLDGFDNDRWVFAEIAADETFDFLFLADGGRLVLFYFVV